MAFAVGTEQGTAAYLRTQDSLISQIRVQALQQWVGASAELAVALHADTEPVHQPGECGGAAAIHAFSGGEAGSAPVCRQCAEVGC